jgi:hypothetical protein
MKKSKRVMRRAVLVSLYDHLQDAYGLEWAREAFVDGQLSLSEVDALLAFKSDPRIDELRGALDRLQSETFGMCLACKGRIDQELLDADPAQRLCLHCERLYNHIVMHTHEVLQAPPI